MTLPLLLIWLSWLAISLTFKRKRSSYLFTSISILFVFATGKGWIYQLLTPSLELKPRIEAPQWAESNVIVVLGGGLSRWPENDDLSSNLWAVPRVMEGARLYHSCRDSGENPKRVCKLLVSGGDPLSLGQTEAEIMKRELQSLGITSEDILTEDQSRNTFQNAKFSREVLQLWPQARVFLVTSNVHLKRANLFFRHFGIGSILAPADSFAGVKSWKTFAYMAALTDLALHETIGVLQYHYYNMTGKNPPPLAVIEN